jgi:hypothetical protein
MVNVILGFRYRYCIPPVEGDREETKTGWLVGRWTDQTDRLETVRCRVWCGLLISLLVFLRSCLTYDHT